MMGAQWEGLWDGEMLIDPPDGIPSELSVDCQIAEPSPDYPNSSLLGGNVVDPQAGGSHSHPPATHPPSYPPSAQEEVQGSDFTRESLPPSTMHSGVANPPSEQRGYLLPSNPSVTVTPPTSQMDVTDPNGREWDIFLATVWQEQDCYRQPVFHNGAQESSTVNHSGELPHQQTRPPKCPFTRYLSHLPQNNPNHAIVVSTAMTLDGLITDDDFSQYYQWKQINTLHSIPPSVSSSHSSGTPGQAGYLCPTARGDQRGPAPSQNPSKYGCPTCSKGFGKRDDLKKHLRAQNPHVEYRCRVPNCSKRRNRKDKYRDHLKNEHPGSRRDDAYLEEAALRITQSFPGTCLHCPQRLQSFEHWFEHWCSDHKANPNTPRVLHQPNPTPRASFNSAVSPGTAPGHPIDRFMELDQFEGFRAGVTQSTAHPERLQRQVNELMRQVQRN